MISQNIKNYQLIDSGLGRKLESISGRLVSRPSPQAIWTPQLESSEWKKVSSEVIRTKDGGGKWIHHSPLPQELVFPFTLDTFDFHFKIKYTSFGHCGIFFEQVAVWEELAKLVLTLKKKLGRPPKILNLFGYTGCASLVMAKAGAKVFHVDSAKGVLTWGKNSQDLSGVAQDTINWVHSDVQEFIKHSLKKQFFYDGILADPPSWGHGVKKEVWDFEKHIHLLINNLLKVLKKNDSFLFLSSHTHGVQSEALKNIIHDSRWKSIKHGDLGVRHVNDERILPAGIYVSAKSF